jgi:hypothetical protein
MFSPIHSASLVGKTCNSGWQRVLRYAYSSHILSRGSTRADACSLLLLESDFAPATLNGFKRFMSRCTTPDELFPSAWTGDSHVYMVYTRDKYGVKNIQHQSSEFLPSGIVGHGLCHSLSIGHGLCHSLVMVYVTARVGHGLCHSLSISPAGRGFAAGPWAQPSDSAFIFQPEGVTRAFPSNVIAWRESRNRAQLSRSREEQGDLFIFCSLCSLLLW